MIRPAKRVAIVGAGPSGLPSARHAILYGFRPVVFEMTGEVGGLWNYKPQDTSVMKSTVINSSKEMSAYSDFPPKPDVANYMHNRKLLEYFQEYAEHYGLRKYIKFHHKVINIQKDFLNFSDGGWHSEEFHGVLLCCGHHKVPHWPDKWPGQDEFKGCIVHSHDYKEPSRYEDKRVVAVGIGNSGADVAVELSRVYLSTRRGAWILNRLHTGGMPLDTSWYVQRTINARFDHAVYGLQPEHDVLGAHTTQNDELPIRIASGTIVVKPNIERFTEHDVHFVDGTKATNIDHVRHLVRIFHHAFKRCFDPFIHLGNPLNWKPSVQPVGSIMPIAEMQARVFFSVLSGESTLPSADEMRKDMLAKREAMKKQYVASYRHTIQVDYIPFMDELATIIGCRPRFWRLLLWDPPLAIAATFGPCAPYVYRIDGPHKWDGTLPSLKFEEIKKNTVLYRVIVHQPDPEVFHGRSLSSDSFLWFFLEYSHIFVTISNISLKYEWINCLSLINQS
ncbi:unnamed protein product [Haemonchus placei]|uniref:Flavin-containing monooxygenase n=1 Tax=Haemonchus placei TaxID=6290 RepID=A0A0N4WI40_HAEPC|nr:unnamed protein product [Haemonchus placei]